MRETNFLFGCRDRIRRIAALLLCVCFISVSLISVVFVSVYSSHEHHTHNGVCVTCVNIIAAEKFLRHVNTAAVFVTVVSVYLFISGADLKPSRFTLELFTPVQLKIRLNN